MLSSGLQPHSDRLILILLKYGDVEIHMSVPSYLTPCPHPTLETVILVYPPVLLVIQPRGCTDL